MTVKDDLRFQGYMDGSELIAEDMNEGARGAFLEEMVSRYNKMENTSHSLDDWKKYQDKKGKRIVHFWTIDDWNRAVFRDSSGNLFGCLDILFDYNATEDVVLEDITEEHLCYFGKNIDDDPMGDYVEGLLIERITDGK